MTTIANDGTTTFTELLKRFYYDADQQTLQRIIGTLSAMKYCSVVYKGEDVIIKYKERGGNG